jgi:hypothetical protein
MFRAFLVGFLLLVGASARAEPPFTNHVNGLNASGTITAGGNFQSVYPQTKSRVGCAIQNNGTGTMYVFFGPISSATHGSSVQLPVGSGLNCNVGNTVLIDQVSVDGTTADAFYGDQW